MYLTELVQSNVRIVEEKMLGCSDSRLDYSRNNMERRCTHIGFERIPSLSVWYVTICILAEPF